MKRFVILHYGFEKPTPQIMEGWNAWFAELGDRMKDQGHFPHGVELSHNGRSALSLGPDAITGFNVIEAESMEEAEALAAKNPFIKAIRVYEVMGG